MCRAVHWKRSPASRSRKHPWLAPLVAPRALVEGQGRRELAVGVNLRLQIRELLLGTRNRVRTGDESPPRRRLARDGQKGLRSLRRVAGLFAVL